jgi:hypothetical protein
MFNYTGDLGRGLFNLKVLVGDGILVKKTEILEIRR